MILVWLIVWLICGMPHLALWNVWLVTFIIALLLA